MSLISDNQKKAAQVPPKPAPLPKPAKSTAPAPEPAGVRVVENAATSGYDEFATGAGTLGLEQALPETIAEPQVAPAPPQPIGDEISQLTDVTRYTGGGAERVPLPQQTVPVAPPVNLWKDASVDFGANNLFSGDIVTTQAPTLYRSPVNTNTGDLANIAYANQDIAGKFAIDQERVRQQQAAARVAQAQVSQRGNLPNVPDVDKPWHEQAVSGVLGFGKSFLFGTDQSNKAANQGEFNPLNGSYGVHGAGIGGALKAALSIPLGLATAVSSDSDRKLIEVNNTIRNSTNPTVTVGGKQVRWNSLSREQKQQYGISDLDNNRAWSKAPVIDSRTIQKPLFDKVNSVLSGAIVGDDIDNANRNLPGIIVSKATGERVSDKTRNGRTDEQLLAHGAYKRAEALDKPTFYQARGRRPGQDLTEDPATLAWSIVNQLASPGNKVDFVGNAIGELAGVVAKPVLKRVLGHSSQTQAIFKGASQAAGTPKPSVDPDFGMGTVPANTPYKPKPTPSANPGLAPVSQPVRVNALPANTLEQAFVNSPAAKVPRTAPPQPRLPAAPDPKLLTGGGDFIVPSLGSEVGLPRIRMNAELDPLVQEAYVINPLARQGANTGEVGLPRVRMNAELDPRALPEGATQEAYIINPLANRGSSEVGLPRVQMEARIESPAIEGVPEQRLLPGAPATPSQVAAEVGIGTPGREITFDINGVTDNLAEITAKPKQPLLPGTTGEALPALPPATVPRTLGELVEQSTTLASHRAVLDSVLGKLEKVFDESLDVGRRAIDELPTTPATVDTLTQALEVGAKLPVEVATVVSKPLAQAILTNDTAAIALARNSGELNTSVLEQAAQAVNAKVDFTTTKVNRSVTPAKLATDVPTTIYHGTALRNWTQDYNVREFGSRGELGTGLYTTVNKAEAANYSRATVGENRSVNIAYDELEPQVVELSTKGLKSTLDARQPIAKPLVKQLLEETGVTMQEIVSKGNLAPGTKPTYVDMVAAVERVAASKDSSEEGLQLVGKQISEALRKQGYDSVFDRDSGWVMLTDNLKLKKPKAKATGKPKATEAAVARYNADTKAAASYPGHVTTDANLRDSAYKVLDQVRSEVDDKLAEVQQQAIERIAKEEVLPVAPVDQAVSNSLSSVDVADVAATTAQIRQYGMSVEPLLLKQVGNTYEVVGNAHVLQAATDADLTKVNAVVVGGKGKRGHLDVDLAKVVGGSNTEAIPTTTSEVLSSIKAKQQQKVFPTVQLSDDGEFYAVVSKDWVVSAYKESAADAEIGVYQLYKGKLSYKKVDVSLVKSIGDAVVSKTTKVVEEVPVAKPPELKGKDVALDDVVAAVKAEVAANGVLSDDYLNRIYRATVDSGSTVGMSGDDWLKPGVSLVHELYSSSPLGFKAAKDGKWLEGILSKYASKPLNNSVVTSAYGDSVAKMLRKFERYGELVDVPVIRQVGFKDGEEVYELVEGIDELTAAAHLYYTGKAPAKGTFNAVVLDKSGKVAEAGLGQRLVDNRIIRELMPKAELDRLAKENARIEKLSQPAPVNPHGNVKEMLENTVDDICNF